MNKSVDIVEKKTNECKAKETELEAAIYQANSGVQDLCFHVDEKNKELEGRIAELYNSITEVIETLGQMNKKLSVHTDTMIGALNKVEHCSNLAIDQVAKMTMSYHKESMESITETDTQLRQYVFDEISSTQNLLDEKLEGIQTILQKLVETNNQLLSENQNLKKDLAFYTEIESDSAKLNSTSIQVPEEQILNSLTSSLGNEIGFGKTFKEIRESNNNSDAPGLIIESTKKSAISLEETPALTLDNEQKEAIRWLQTSDRNLFITGKAGTGKSFLLSAFFIIVSVG